MHVDYPYLIVQSVIGLDNNDFIIHIKKKNYYDVFMIYRLKNNNYTILQGIEPTDYTKIKLVEKISENRFVTISDKGYEIFCLGDDDKYFSEIYIDNYFSYIKKIYEANKNELIICAIEEFVSKKSQKCNEIPTYEIRTSLKNRDSKLFIFLECGVRKSENNHPSFFSDGIFLKDKYFLIMIDNNLLIIYILTGDLIKVLQ